MRTNLCLTIIFAFLLVEGHAQSSFEYKGDEVALRGKWDFYWKELILPDSKEQSSQAINVELPSYWNKHPEISPRLPAFGYATYSALILADQDYRIGLRYDASHSAQRIYVNGELIAEIGKVSTTREGQVSQWIPGTVEARLNKGENRISFQISNYEHSKGGVYAVPTIGSWEVMKSSRERQLLLESFIIGCLFLIGFFFIALYLIWRQARAFIVFAIFALSFALWYGNFGLQVMKLFVDMDWLFALRLSYFALYVSFALMILFMYSSFRGLFKKWIIQLCLVVNAAMNAFVLFSPAHVFTDQIIYTHSVGLLTLAYSTIIAFVAVFKKMKGSVLTAISLVSYGVAMLVLYATYNDIFEYQSEVIGLLFLNSFLVFGVMLAQRIELTFSSVSNLEIKAREQKEQIQLQAAKLKRLDQFKSRFFANVSHDFRSPLTLIKGYIDILKNEKNVLTEKSELCLRHAEENVAQLVSLTTEIGKLIKLDEGKINLSFTAVNIVEHARLDVDMFQTMASQNEISLSFETNLPENTIIHADDLSLKKIIYNLISNAIKYTQKTGNVAVGLDQNGANGVILSIKDDGEGIDEEDLPFIFDRFYQSVQNHHKLTEGMGIGLALVKELVELHGGEISIESQIGKGSLFKVQLPVNLHIPIEPPTEDNYRKSKSLNVNLVMPKNTDHKSSKCVTTKLAGLKAGNKLLVVDDHPEIRNYICAIVDKEYEIIQAGDGVEALRVLAIAEIDLVITDLMMPNMDGNTLVRKMKENLDFSSIPIIAISARTSEEVIQEMIDAGADLFITKPFDADKLNESIKSVLQG